MLSLPVKFCLNTRSCSMTTVVIMDPIELITEQYLIIHSNIFIKKIKVKIVNLQLYFTTMYNLTSLNKTIVKIKCKNKKYLGE